MNLPWLRLYTEFATDPIVQMLAFEDQRHFVVALCMKGNGVLDKEYPSEDFRQRVIAATLGLDPAACSEVARRLVEAGLIDDKWHPVNWRKRQFASDHNAAERKRKQRDRDSHGDVTANSRDSHAVDTDRDTDSDTEKSKRGSRKRAARVPDEFSPDLDYAIAQIPDIDAKREAQKFRDWEFKTPRSDWAAAWRNWIGRCRETGQYAKVGSNGVRWQ